MLNKAIIMGRLTRDVELRHTTNGIPTCSFTVAVDRNFARQGEQKQTDFINVVCWRGTAEFVSKYFSKGRMIVVVGAIQTRTWDDPQSGAKRYATEVVASEVFFGESKRDSGSDGGYGGGDYEPIESGGLENSGFTPTQTDDDLPF